MNSKFVFILICVLLSSGYAKKRSWEPAVIIKVESGSGGAAALPVGNIIVAVPITRIRYTLETASMLFVLSSEHNFSVTIGKQIQLAVDGKYAYFVDDDGKERKLYIFSKQLKPKAP